MAFNDRNIITCVEFGTSRIRALHGCSDKAGNPCVLGFGEVPSEHCVCKGEISDVKAASEALSKALHAADQSANRDFPRKDVFCIVNSGSITSRQGEGNVMIYDENRKVRTAHIEEAVEKALSLSLPPDQTHLNSFDSYFMLDSKHQVQNPEGQTASRLDAFLHIISVESNRLETMKSILADQGFENDHHFVFAAAASAFSVLRPEEKNHGVLLIDMGAGLTSYIAVHKDGVLASGVLAVGTDNIANDLSIGLDLSIDYCRKLIMNPNFLRDIKSGVPYIKIAGNTHGLTRNIPIASFEKIMDLRLRETFSILCEKLNPVLLSSRLENGIVFCGGGALVPFARDILYDVSHMRIRLGEPNCVTGAMSGLNSPCRYTALMGLLKYAIDFQAHSGGGNIGKVGDLLEDFSENIFNKFKTITKVFKI